MSLLSFLDREHTIAGDGYSRWLVPPAALAIHLSIGQAYAFSVFNLPLSQRDRRHALGAGRLEAEHHRLGVQRRDRLPRAFGGGVRRVARARRAAQGDVRLRALLRRRIRGRRRSASRTHQFWLLLLGYGVLGGIGLGLGYISPVSTLIKWFPDRPGMATGMAIMGFGGGAMIASPLSTMLMAHFKTAAVAGRRADVRGDGRPLFRAS